MTSKVLVTGGTGYIAGELIGQLLVRGWTVHTTVRSTQQSGDLLRSRWPDAGAQLKVFEAHLLSDTGWAEAVDGCTHVAHVASPVSASTPKDENEMIAPAREGALRALRFAKAAGVKRFVHTSSVAAVYHGRSEQEFTATEADWTDIDDPQVGLYSKSKTISERAARDWIAAEGGTGGSQMDYVSVNPALVLGPIESSDYSVSLEAIKRLLDGSMPSVPDFSVTVVDLRDVAALHVKCLEEPGLSGQRFLAGGKSMKLIEIAGILRENLGNAARKVPTKIMPRWQVAVLSLFVPALRLMRPQLGQIRHVDASHARNRLDWKSRPEEESILDCARSLIAHGVIKG